MKLLFLLLLCVLILSQSARSPSFHIRFHGSSSSPIASFVEPLFFTFFHWWPFSSFLGSSVASDKTS